MRPTLGQFSATATAAPGGRVTFDLGSSGSAIGRVLASLADRPDSPVVDLAADAMDDTPTVVDDPTVETASAETDCDCGCGGDCGAAEALATDTTTVEPDVAAADDTVPAAADVETGDGADDTFRVQIDPANPGRFVATLVVENERTADDRMIAKGATSWRETPLPLMLMTQTAPGHDGAVIAGAIEKIVRKGNKIVGEGRFDTSPDGVEAARLVAEGMLTGVSIDGGDVSAEVVVEEEDDNGYPTKVLYRVDAITILGATIVPFPAIGSTSIEHVMAAADDTDTDVPVAEMRASMTASGPLPFPADYFADPALPGPTTIRVAAADQDGYHRVYGHMALWGQCHIGITGVCTTPPRSQTDYANFMFGSLPTTDGGEVRVGKIAMNAMHADHKLGARDAIAHYDHTGTTCAYVAVGEDEHGIWVAGVLKPGLSDVDATEFAASSLSGDWRLIGGNLELVATLAVNTPGFPVMAMQDDRQVSLVAAGYGPVRRTRQEIGQAIDRVETVIGERFSTLEDQVAALTARLDRMTAMMTPIVRERLAASFATTAPTSPIMAVDATI